VKLSEVDTPALIIDMDLAEKNIQTMHDFLAPKKCKLRAHTKIHKSPFLAYKEIAGGSSGITCAKLGEAEVMAQAGISDILIANEIVGKFKAQRLANLAKYCDVKVAVDDLGNARDISSAASTAGSEVGLVVDVNMSGGGTSGEKKLDGVLNRCGVPTAKAGADLAVEITKLPNVRLRGVMGYEGGLVENPDAEESKAITRQALERLVSTKDAVEDRGIEVGLVSCGSSTSYKVAADTPGITEIQAGSYILMDTYHHRYSPEFDYALWVEAQVISLPKPDRAILDAGGNAISGDAGLPQLRIKRDDMKIVELNAEHIHVETTGAILAREDRLQIVPSNIDTTTCLHDNYFVTRKGEVEMLVPVAARGKFQ
jgi:D-serine deaminase-like pyridoxal phosphate-dependent protein